MRSDIRAVLETVPQLTGKIFQPNTASASQSRPYCVLKLGNEVGQGDTFVRAVEIWLYEDPYDFRELDSLAGVVVQTIRKSLSPLEYNGIIVSDYYDEDLKAYATALSYSAPMIY